MNRLGLNDHDFNFLYESIQNKTSNVSALTHFAESEDIDPTFTNEQIQKFHSLVKNKNLKPNHPLPSRLVNSNSFIPFLTS